MPVIGLPLRLAAVGFVRLIRPLGSRAVDRPTPACRPRAIVGCSSGRSSARCSSTTCSTGAASSWPRRSPTSRSSRKDWGFRLDEVKVPVRWWHGDKDHIVPFEHGEHVVSQLPDAELYTLPGESHLGGLGRGEEILETLIEVWEALDKER